jgi:hypothetical protein
MVNSVHYFKKIIGKFIMFQKPSRIVDRIFVHCSASDHASHDNVATMRRWHLERGWSDVGYHFFIRKDGTLERGRPLNRTPAAQRNHNSGTIAICLHGLREEKFTEAQLTTLRNWCFEVNEAYNGSVTFHGHCEVAAKACPVIDYKSVLKLDRFGRLGLEGVTSISLKETDAGMPTLRRGDRGPAVVRLQQLLLLKPDGIFGPRTENAVKDFQKSAGLSRDGVVGPITWGAILENEQIEHLD